MAQALLGAGCSAFIGQVCNVDSDCGGRANTSETGGLEKCVGATDDDVGECECYWSWGTEGDGCHSPGPAFGWYITVCLLRSLMMLLISVRSVVALARLQRQLGCSVASFCSSTMMPVVLIFIGSVTGTLQPVWYPLIIWLDPDMGYRDARRVHYFLLGASAMLGLASILLTALNWLELAMTSKALVLRATRNRQMAVARRAVVAERIAPFSNVWLESDLHGRAKFGRGKR